MLGAVHGLLGRNGAGRIAQGCRVLARNRRAGMAQAGLRTVGMAGLARARARILFVWDMWIVPARARVRAWR